MSYGSFTERTAQPSIDDMVAVLGRARQHWEAIVAVAAELGAKAQPRFYGRNYGWALTFRRRGRAILALYPGVGSLVALVVLDEAQVSEALALRLTPAVQDLIERTPPIKEGRWVFVPVTGAAVARDVQRLVRIRAT
jgi:hypothetical protein